MKPPSAPTDEVQAAVERERRRIGDYLHENLCQSLAVLSIQVALLRRQLQSGKPVEEALEALSQGVQSVIAQAHAAASELQAPLPSPAKQRAPVKRSASSPKRPRRRGAE